MGTKAAGRTGWTRGSDGALKKGRRDVQPVAHKKDEGCDLGSGADVDRLPAPGQFACATGCTTPGIERSPRRLLPALPSMCFEGPSGVLPERDSKIHPSEGVSMKLEHNTLVTSDGKKIITGT
jgi:hypothetical protein